MPAAGQLRAQLGQQILDIVRHEPHVEGERLRSVTLRRLAALGQFLGRIGLAPPAARALGRGRRGVGIGRVGLRLGLRRRQILKQLQLQRDIVARNPAQAEQRQRHLAGRSRPRRRIARHLGLRRLVRSHVHWRGFGQGVLRRLRPRLGGKRPSLLSRIPPVHPFRRFEREFGETPQRRTCSSVRCVSVSPNRQAPAFRSVSGPVGGTSAVAENEVEFSIEHNMDKWAFISSCFF
ncbi:MAG: hypothetical protein WDN69_29855 [Aliidongia sp.]